MDFDKLRQATEHVGYPVLPVVQQLVALCKDGLGQWAHWGATIQDITDTATVPQIRSSLEAASTVRRSNSKPTSAPLLAPTTS